MASKDFQQSVEARKDQTMSSATCCIGRSYFWLSRSSRPAEIPSLKSLLTLAVFVVVVAGLYLAREILIPVTLAVLLSFVLAPVAKLLRSMKLGKVLSVLLAVILALCVVLAIGGLIGTQLAEVAEQAPRYQSTIQHKIEAARSLALGKMSVLAHRFGRQLKSPGDDQNAHPSNRGASEPLPGADQKPLPVEVHQPDPSPVELAGRILTPVVSPLSTLAIVFVIAIFVLLQREDLFSRDTSIPRSASSSSTSR